MDADELCICEDRNPGVHGLCLTCRKPMDLVVCGAQDCKARVPDCGGNWCADCGEAFCDEHLREGMCVPCLEAFEGDVPEWDDEPEVT